MKKLMILGASILQLPAIEKAKEMGVYVISVDKDEQAIGRHFSDKFYSVSTMDQEKVLNIAKEEKIDGIMTLASDQPMKVVSYVGEKLGLHTISRETALNTTNKGSMRKMLEASEIPIPNYRLANNRSEFLSNVERFNCPFIVKPTDSSGSRGVNLVRTTEEIDEAYEYSSKYSGQKQVIIEEFLAGREFSVETFSSNGTVQVIAITEKVTTGAPHFVEVGHAIPAELTANERSEIEEIVEKTILALNISVGPTHCEVMLTERGPKIVEIGARLGGDNITTHLVPLATGYDLLKDTIMCALGNNKMERILFNRKAIINYFYVNEKGKLKEIKGLDQIRNSEYLVDLKILKNIGDDVSPISSSNDRIGYFILCGEDFESVESEANNLLYNVEILVDSVQVEMGEAIT